MRPVLDDPDPRVESPEKYAEFLEGMAHVESATILRDPSGVPQVVKKEIPSE